MTDRVRVLSSHLIDQIAAGEVVERPASVVKELVENAMDAGAGKVFCRVEEGGRSLIEVSDDGEGMSRADVMLATCRHATSKISSVEDLSHIVSLGFRGEALSSIAAVSRMRIVTKRREDDSATRLEIEGGQRGDPLDAGAPVGTEVRVADLFYNTPARQKFLRRPATEISHIQTWMARLGLAGANVHLRLQHGKRTLLDAPASEDFAQRVAAIVGREVFDHLHQVEFADDGSTVSGLISDPMHSRPNTRGMYVYVNGRFVRDRMLQNAVMIGYQTVLPPGRYPLAVLHVQVDPGVVDVNVHPQKTEVRFSEPNRIHRVVKTAVAELLARAPWLSGSRTYVLDGGGPGLSAQPRTESGERVREAMTRFYARPSATGARGSFGGSRTPPAAIAADAPDVADAPKQTPLPLSQWHLVGTLWHTYLLLSSPGELVLVDQHAAAERIVFERLRASVLAGKVAIQGMLVPVQIELDGAAMACFEAHGDSLRQLGFEIAAFGEQTINVTGVPALLSKAPVSELVRDALEQLAESGEASSWEEARLEVISRMACHAAIRAGQTLSETEIRALLTQLEGVDFSGTCPHGRPVMVPWAKAEVERWFHRS